MTRNGGGTRDSALGRCVAGAADTFADEYWGRAPLLTRAAERAGGFDDLLDATAVDELVSARGLRTPFLRMAKDGAVLPPARYTRGGGAGASIPDQVADDRVLTTLADGATLVLQALHRTWPPLVRFGAQLATEVGHPVQINAYITPPQNQGFAPHYDVHDVFVLQVSGRKKWTIHRAGRRRSPLDNQPWEQASAPTIEARVGRSDPLIDTVLEPGDAVYLPRGTIHAAQALGETSIHLTIGVHPITRYQLVRHLLEAVQDDPALRASLPMGADLADPAVLGAAPGRDRSPRCVTAPRRGRDPERVARPGRGRISCSRTRAEAISPLGPARGRRRGRSPPPRRCVPRAARCVCARRTGRRRLGPTAVLLDRTRRRCPR